MAKETSSRAKNGMGGAKRSSKKSGKKPHSIHVHRGKSGGFLAEHHFDNSGKGPDEPPDLPETHVIPDQASLADHMASQMGDQPPAPQAPPEQAQAGPQAGPAPQQGM